MAVLTAPLVRDEYNTLNLGTVERQQIQISDIIDQKEPGKMPFVVLMKRGLGKKTVANWRHNWFLDSPFPHIDTLNGTVNGCTAGASVAVTVDHGEYWQVWDTFVETSSFGVFRITAISGDELTCYVVAAPSGSNMADGDEIINTGSAYESGADYKLPRSTIETQDYNYGQIFRETVGMTEVQQMTQMLAGGPDWAYQVRKLMPAHARKLERAFIFNERAYLTSGTHPAGMMRGLHRWAVAGGQGSASMGVFTVAKLDAILLALANADQETERKYYGFASKAVIAIISRICLAAGTYQITSGQNEWGVRFTSVQGAAIGQPLTLVDHPEFNQSTGLAAAMYVVAFNPERQKYVTFKGNGVNLDTHVRAQIQDPGETIRVDELYTMASTEWHYPESNLAYINGITAS